ncbi:MAG: hypothetical protein SFX73_28820 [Kofleriaceae bacterium]|nr:hypothetical protein [Kofleriaceae bacterium]
MKGRTISNILSLSLCALPLVGCGTDTPPCDPDAPGTICTIAGKDSNQGYKGDGGLAINATLYIPMDTVVGPDGNIWMMDFNNYVIRSIDSEGIINTIIGNGELGSSPASDAVSEIPALEAANNHTPTMVMHENELYLAAWHESRVKRVRCADMMMENVAGIGARTQYSGDGGPAIQAALDLPSSIAFAPDGSIAITDQANGVIRRVSTDGIISTIAGKCIIEERTCINMNRPPVACPGSQKLTCADNVEASCSGPAVCTLGNATNTGDGGPAVDARFALMGGQAAIPQGRIAYDNKGNLLIADTENHRIRKLDTNGIITTFAGNGMSGYTGEGGPATAAQLNKPIDIEVAPDDTVYITDMGNSCVRKIDLQGNITTVAGMCNPDGREVKFAGDGGPATEANLNRPYGIDLVGNKLYISDSYNNRLRVVNLE